MRLGHATSSRQAWPGPGPSGVSRFPSLALDGKELPLDDVADEDAEAAVGDPPADGPFRDLGDGGGLVEGDQLGELVVGIEAHASIVPGQFRPRGQLAYAVGRPISRDSGS